MIFMVGMSLTLMTLTGTTVYAAGFEPMTYRCQSQMEQTKIYYSRTSQFVQVTDRGRVLKALGPDVIIDDSDPGFKTVTVSDAHSEHGFHEWSLQYTLTLKRVLVASPSQPTPFNGELLKRLNSGELQRFGVACEASIEDF